MTKHEDGQTKWLCRAALMFCAALGLALLAGAGCSDDEGLFIECSRNDECGEEQVCLNQICQSPQCETEEIVCDRQCVNPRITLEFCGGCGGCPQVAGADAVQCIEGQCVYQCQEGLADANGDVDSVNGDGCECEPDGAEVCDGRDNDCDGLLDGADDDLVACPSEPGSQAQCAGGVCELACEAGFADVNGDLGSGADGCECEQDGPEVCDGVDNDCDGLVDREDEDLEVAQEVCDGVDNDCDGLVDREDEDLVVNPEVCDGVDNDCDGDIDGRDDDFVAPGCALNQGVCAGLGAQCIGGEAQECSVVDYALHASGLGQRFQSDETICDDQDNDCDGEVDELCCGVNPIEETLIERSALDLVRVDVAVREDATQAALLIAPSRGLSTVVLVDELGRQEVVVDGVGGANDYSQQATLHRDEERELYMFVNVLDDVLRVVEISDTGVRNFPRTINTSQQFFDAKVVGFGDGVFVVSGYTIPDRELAFIRVANNRITGQGVLRQEDMGGLVVSYESAVRQDDDMIITAEIADTASASNLERELALMRIDFTGGVPTPRRDTIVRYSKDSTDEFGAGSGGAFVDGDILYRVVQQDGLIKVVRQDWTRGLAGTEEAVFGTLARDRVNFEHVLQLEDKLLLDVEVGDIGGPVEIFTEGEMATTAISPFSLEGAEFAQKLIAPHPYGAFVFWTLYEGFGSNDSGRIEVSILNRLGQPLCPWNP